jgi:hypothetical protein
MSVAQQCVCRSIRMMDKPDSDDKVAELIDIAKDASLPTRQIDALRTFQRAMAMQREASDTLATAKRETSNAWDAVKNAVDEQSDLFDPDEADKLRREDERRDADRAAKRAAQIHAQGIASHAGKQVDLLMNDGTVVSGTLSDKIDDTAETFKILPVGAKRQKSIAFAAVGKVELVDAPPEQATDESAEEVAAYDAEQRNAAVVEDILGDAAQPTNPENEAHGKGAEAAKSGCQIADNPHAQINSDEPEPGQEAQYTAWKVGFESYTPKSEAAL